MFRSTETLALPLAKGKLFPLVTILKNNKWKIIRQKSEDDHPKAG